MPSTNKRDERIDTLDRQRQALQRKGKNVLPFLVALPIMVALASFLIWGLPQVSIISTFVSIVIAGALYSKLVGNQFHKLQNEVKQTLIHEYISHYYSDIYYNYYPDKKYVTYILNSSRLISADRHHEEDVVKGTYKGSDFYFSEIVLENESKDEDKTRTTVFRGILFDLTIPGADFPKTRIQSRKGLLQVLFGSSLSKEVDHEFYYETDSEERFYELLGPLFPFIEHLMKKQGAVRISAHKEKLTIMMPSDMKFLDEPRFTLSRPVDDPAYKRTLAQQLNTLLFIVDAFTGKLVTEEIEEKLVLKSLEYERLYSDDHEV